MIKITQPLSEHPKFHQLGQSEIRLLFIFNIIITMYDKNLDGYNFFVPLSHNVQMVTLKYYLLVSPAFISEFII